MRGLIVSRSTRSARRTRSGRWPVLPACTDHNTSHGIPGVISFSQQIFDARGHTYGVVATEVDKSPGSRDTVVYWKLDCAPDRSIAVVDIHTNPVPFVGTSGVEAAKRWGSSHHTSIALDLKNCTLQEEAGAFEMVPSADDAVLLV